MKVYGRIFVVRGNKKKALEVYVGEAEDKNAALKMAAAFLRERAEVGLSAEVKIQDEGSIIAHIKLTESKPLEIEAGELDMLEKGLLT